MKSLQEALEYLKAHPDDGAIFETGSHSYIYTGLSQEFTVTHPSDRPALDALRKQVAQHGKSVLGFLSYDAVRLFENIPDRHKASSNFPELQFNFYNHVFCIEREKISLELKKGGAHSNTDLSDENFMDMVKKAKKHIIDGDVFQVVLSRKFTTPYSVSPVDIFQTLRTVSPAPYLFYIPTKHGTLVGASPEKLISVKNRHVEITPIAGTRPRHDNLSDDDITIDLLNDKKEVAEHMMLVDLARNDIGATCKPGTVNPTTLCQVKHFSHVSHIASKITGELRDDKDALDALTAAFPAGTLSGAPKIRAMEIIDALETSRRNIYGGAIVQLQPNGDLDSCIAIRMATLHEGIATVRTGAGIVFDSNPEMEAHETRHKAKNMLETLATAEASFA